MKILGFIPARGGSKSIKLKNVFRINKYPLIQYSYKAAKRSKIFSKIVCSTDNELIKKEIDDKYVIVDTRPRKLSGDKVNVVKVVLDYLQRSKEKFDWVFLIQPTSPFVLPSHFKSCIKVIKKYQEINSVQTVCSPPHNYHPYNSRVIKNNKIGFLFKNERLKSYNKQKKIDTYIFGNLVATRVKSLLQYSNFFAEPSYPIKIDRKYCFDFDTLEDVEIGKLISKAYFKELKKEIK